MTGLLLVEGFPGSGKSTTAQWLARQWQRSGYPCRWFYEQQADHPVAGIPAGADYTTWEEYFDDRRSRWAAFVADTARDEGRVILESALLQYSIFVTLRRGVPAGAILDFLRSVVDVIRPLAPRLVYLAAPDPDTAFRTISARRGAAHMQAALAQYETGEAGEFFRAHGLRGFDGLLAYWREHNSLCERAVQTLGLDTLVVDPRHGDWPWRRAAIARFLGLPPTPDAAPSAAELERWVGRYRVVWEGRPRDCVVSMEDGRLVINGLFWPDNGLLWKHDNVFDAESWPFEVVFEPSADGGVGALSVTSPSPWPVRGRDSPRGRAPAAGA